ncbi:unnamed protein product [Cyprideis torosa]|uniref:Uncharacterized protein n=1 Tax=Cyprideis torosa TaxID=163714 RepID=A0A7R8WB83_9CRUS|nr:unnamed protein product [Cyprideis torosa]CAG0886632.1 unnamed protein product [Cyprideis torosa]
MVVFQDCLFASSQPSPGLQFLTISFRIEPRWSADFDLNQGAQTAIITTHEEMKNDADLFQRFLQSHPRRLAAVQLGKETTGLIQKDASWYRNFSDGFQEFFGSGFHILILIFFIITVFNTAALIVSIIYGEPEVTPHGAVVSDHPTCSRIGKEALQRGGSAVDAAVAVAFCLSVVIPHTIGPGGGGFMLVHNHRKSDAMSRVINFREAAPLKFTNEMLLKQDGSADQTHGPVFIATPGFVAGLGKAHALDGVHLPRTVEAAINSFGWLNGIGLRSKATASPGSLLKRMSDSIVAKQRFSNPELASIYQVIASKGWQAFYNGTLGTGLLGGDVLKSALTMADLGNYSARLEKPLNISLSFGKTMLSSRAPSGGSASLLALGLLSYKGLKPELYCSVEAWHLILEAMKYSHVDFSRLGDPDFEPIVRNRTSVYLAPKMIQSEADHLSLAQAMAPKIKEPRMPEASFSVVTVADNNDQYVSLVSGLNEIFGSRIEHPAGAYFLNNANANFFPRVDNDTDIKKQNEQYDANFVAPGKRPLSTAAPVIVLSTSNVCGDRLITGGAKFDLVVQVLVNHFMLGRDLSESVKDERLHTIMASIAMSEDNYKPFNEYLRRKLKNLTHQIFPLKPPYPSINAILKDGDVLTAQADPRGGGGVSDY